MKNLTKISALTLTAGTVALGGAAGASAAETTTTAPSSYIHQTTATRTPAACHAAAHRFAHTVKATKVDPCHLTMSGWASDVTYTATAPKVSGDVPADQMWAGEYVVATLTYDSPAYKTKAQAQRVEHRIEHRLRADRNDVDRSSVSGSVTQAADGTWSTSVSWHGSTQHMPVKATTITAVA